MAAVSKNIALTTSQIRALAKKRVAAQRDSETLTRAAAAYAEWGTAATRKTARRLHTAASCAQLFADDSRAEEARLRREVD